MFNFKFTRQALAGALLSLPLLASAAFPDKAVKLVVPYAPGGSADIAARLISDEWAKALGGTMFIENKAGAGGNIVATSQPVLVVNKHLPANSIKELVALLKAQPGKFTYGSAGSGSTFHISAELFKAVANVPLVHIPYRGGGPALIDTIGGQVDMSFPVVSAAQQHVAGGKLRALGVTGAKRSSLLPSVPTLAEAGLPN